VLAFCLWRTEPGAYLIGRQRTVGLPRVVHNICHFCPHAYGKGGGVASVSDARYPASLNFDVWNPSPSLLHTGHARYPAYLIHPCSPTFLVRLTAELSAYISCRVCFQHLRGPEEAL